uniref:COP9 signalosome complex subunit 3 N-terminal helical repeats domain-containing protein n=1 Tax=Octactis speculum TaxID=3111310 RepID=A0A7S2MKY8_9STRA|mmetsp:Transcript_64498/g.88611  ORF Transcript_64498/g.88611 Transcript_64498/m.88611 type:complete len:126 (+) Transcript_64498:115-492(+)
MDAILQQIHSLSTVEEIGRLQENLKNAHEVLHDHALNGGLLQIVAATLDQTRHSLGVLHMLAAQSTVLAEADMQPFFNQTRIFIALCDPVQIQKDTKLFVDVCRKFTEVATKLRGPCVMYAIKVW